MAEGQRAAALVLVDGAAPPGVEAALFEAMLAGWRRQQQARRLSAEFVGRRERVVRRFAVFTGGWPWCWTGVFPLFWTPD
jgi:integrase/recombinase XerC